jgi:hypothetical protein
MKARPTVLGLMGVVACIAIGLAALRSNDEFSAAVVFALTYLVLCTSTLVAIYRRGAWAGFAVFGWAQFLICQPNTAPPVGATSLSNGIAYRLLIRHHGTGQEIPPPSRKNQRGRRKFRKLIQNVHSDWEFAPSPLIFRKRIDCFPGRGNRR